MRTAWRRRPAGCRAATPRGAAQHGREGLHEFLPRDPKSADAARRRPAAVAPAAPDSPRSRRRRTGPCVMATKPMPSISSGVLKEKRATPELTSVPTMPSSRPRTVMRTALSSRAARHRHGGDEAEHHQREIFGGVELERQICERRRERRDHQRRHAACKERSQRGDGQRRAGAALPRHLVPVENGDDRRHLARQIDQDGGCRAAVRRRRSRCRRA